MTVAELYPHIKPFEDGLIYLEVLNTPSFRLTGCPWKDKNKNYHRMDDEFRETYNPGIKRRTAHTSGVQVSLRTNSKRFGVHMVLNDAEYMNHMPDNAVGGADIYLGSGTEKRYWHIIWNERSGDIRQVEYTEGIMNDFCVNFPLYSEPLTFEIGLCPEAEIEESTPYAVQKPVVFYGSSITQGGCTSHPGNMYINTVSRMLNIETICLGFSGACIGEPEIEQQIEKIDVSAFVMDYDYNASGAEHLKATHEPFFKAYRAAHPTTPVVFMTKPDFDDNPTDGMARKEVILQTYNNAIAAGDKNVYFIDGQTVFGDFLRDSCTVDRNHPSDLGHARIAKAVADTLKQCLSI